ncbi:MAG: subclass B3 metallo-beta-lactamase [Thermoanaerobaculia bacterium]|nr:subclass B3 metallo-beta-lactamase [Thermoanaerobaculia bacterium]
MRQTAVFSLCALFALRASTAAGQATEEWRSWNQPVEPFRIAESLYYVGASDIASYLITTPVGHILIDGGFVETAPQIEANISKLGFKVEEVKILLNSHAHFDHAGGLAALKARSGAKLFASAPDATLLESGGKGDFRFGDEGQFPPVVVDRRLADGEAVTLGGATLTARLTPGHTRGATTWTFKAGSFDVVVVSSASILDYRFVGKESYPGIAADFERTFAVLEALPVQIFLAPHGGFFDLAGKRERAASGMGLRNPWVDPAGYKAWVARAKGAFLAAVESQKAEEKAPVKGE